MLAKNVLGENDKLFDPTEKYKGIFGFFKRAIKKRVLTRSGYTNRKVY